MILFDHLTRLTRDGEIFTLLFAPIALCYNMIHILSSRYSTMHLIIITILIMIKKEKNRIQILQEKKNDSKNSNYSISGSKLK